MTAVLPTASKTPGNAKKLIYNDKQGWGAS